MNSTTAGPGFEIVARQDFSDVTFLLEVRHPMLAKAARPGQFVIVMSQRARRAHPAHHRRLRPRHAAPSRWSSRRSARPRARCSATARSATGSSRWSGRWASRATSARRSKVLCVGGGLGVAPVYPQARGLQGERRLRDRHPRLPQHATCVLGGQVPRLLRRADRLHRRRLGRHQGPGHRGHPAGDREAPGHRRVRRDRPAGDDEGLRRGDAAAQDPHHRQPEPGDGGRHRHVRRLPREDRRRREVRLRRRPRLRRPPGRLRRPDVPPAALPRDRARGERALRRELPHAQHRGTPVMAE